MKRRKRSNAQAPERAGMDLFRDRDDVAADPAYAPPPSTLHASYPPPGPEPVPIPAHVPPRPEWAARHDRGDFVKWGFYAGLAGGVLILLCAFTVALLMTVLGFLGAPDLAWAFDGDAAIDDDGWSPVAPFLFALWGLLTGGAVILAALRLKETPHASAMPGVVMLLAGIMSFVVLGGFLVGGILALVAGVLAIAGARSVLLVRSPRHRGAA